MNHYNKLISDNINHALIPNEYLEFVKNETDTEKRYLI